MIGPEVRDYTSGFIAARAVVLRQLRLRGDYGEYCIDLLGRALATGRRVQEVPYVCVPRTEGESKTGANLWDYLVKGRKYVATIWRVRRRLRFAY
jgi:dolichol-phosphate mannosyltransferase